MKKIFFIFLFLIISSVHLHRVQQNDDDFKEFDFDDDSTPTTTNTPSLNAPLKEEEKVIDEDFDEESIVTKPPLTKTSQNDLDTEEFEHFIDDEEFETPTPKVKTSKKDEPVNLKINKVPTHLLTNNNWTNYIYELVMISLILIYLIFFLIGKSKNYKLVNAWYQANRDLLEKNFALVGDDGQSSEIRTSSSEQGLFIKDSENSYGLWCSGRQGCDGLLIQLKLVKRQDLINGVIMQLVKPQADQIVFSVEYPNKEDIDSFVFCLTNKKNSQTMFNDYQDLSSFCVEKKPSNSVQAQFADLLTPQVAQKYVVLNEIGEVPNYVMDKTLCAFLNKYPEMVDYILVSDQYVGVKSQQSEEQSISEISDIGLPKSKCVLIMAFNVPGRGLNTSVDDMESMFPALQLALYLIDRVPRIRLSKEAKMKAVKKRRDISEQILKMKNKELQEAAMARKEEKRRAEKEKIMNESDPEKQKRLEEKELKREKKKTLSKMKQIKIKSM